jgi:hypothetical protein
VPGYDLGGVAAAALAEGVRGLVAKLADEQFAAHAQRRGRRWQCVAPCCGEQATEHGLERGGGRAGNVWQRGGQAQRLGNAQTTVVVMD